ncbi:MAG TPA: protein kinase [Gemmataceae bacterium]|nr:protein kinase [Gemmataceae bacterium]
MAKIESCPDRTAWGLLLEGNLSDETQQELTAHLDACAACRQVVDELAAAGQSWSKIPAALAKAGDRDVRLAQVMAELKSEESKLGETLTQPGTADSQTGSTGQMSASSAPHERLGHYEIREVIGKGGMGVVLKAYDQKLQRIVAIKIMAPELAANVTARQRFIREARAAAAVSHDHIVTIHEVQEDHSPPYFVMPYIVGMSLQERLDKKGPFGLKEILRIGLQAANGLAAAHAQGLVHRDIKPANILLENGVERVKITDFGLARAVDDASVTQSGVISGTPMFMSPEQAAGETVDHRSDLFSLGSVLYMLCTGRPPFRATGTMAVMKRVIEDRPRPIREINPEMPDWLEAIIAKLHAKNSEDRFQSAKEVAQLLEQHLAHLQQPGTVPMPARISVPPPQHELATDPVVKSALRRVRTPAIGLFVTGILYWAGIPLAAWLRFHNGEQAGGYLWWSFGVLPAIAGFMLMFGGWKMKSCEYYGFSLATACLPLALLAEKLWALSQHRIAMGPGDWTALPFGMWALLVLTRHDVREAFAYVRRMVRPAESPGRIANSDTATLRRWRILLAMLLAPSLSVPVAMAANYLFGGMSDWVFGSVVAAGLGVIFTGLSFLVFVIRRMVSKSGAKAPPLWWRLTELILLGVLVLAGLFLFIPWAPLYIANHSRAEIEPQEGLTSVIILQNGVSVTDWMDMRTSRTITLSPGKYHMNPGLKPGYDYWTISWEITTFGLLSSHTVRQPGSDGSGCDFEVQRGERVTIRPIIRKATVLPPIDSTDSQGWVQLFNGKNLTGWKAQPDQPGKWEPGTWQVIEGILVGTGPGQLYTVRDDYQNFRLRAEMRISTDADNGIYFRAKMQPSNAPGKGRNPVGYVVDIAEGKDSYTGPISFRNPQNDSWTTRGANSIVKPGEWFTLELIADGNHLVSKVNGVTAVDFVDETNAFQKGHIALQVWKRQNVNFRKIEIKELPAARSLPTQPADVLPFAVGTWQCEAVTTVPKVPPEHARSTGVSNFDLVADGKFLRGYTIGDEGRFENLVVQSYDKDKNAILGWFFTSWGEATGPGIGVFDVEKQTILWMEKLPGEIQAIHQFEFVDANTIKTRLFHQNAKNQIVLDSRNTFTRLDKPAERKPQPIDPQRPQEMKILDRLVGIWQDELTRQDSPQIDRPKLITKTTAHPILAGHFIEATEDEESSGVSTYWLATFDGQRKKYRLWQFGSSGNAEDLEGSWDEASQSMHWKSLDNSVEIRWTFKSDDLREVRAKIKNRKGEIIQDLSGMSKKTSPGGPVSKKPRPTPTDEIALEYRQAIANGLDYLAKQQKSDGHWEAVGGQYSVSMTALAGMAMLMEGSTEDDGKYSASIRKAVDWLMNCSQPNGLLNNPNNSSDSNRYMFGHGYAMLFLATVYTQERDGERRRKLEKILTKAVEFTGEAQVSGGGWGYLAAKEGKNFDESATTITQLQALRAARNAGIVVPRKLIDADYLRKCTTQNGAIVYSISNRDGGDRPALAAAALAAGEYDSDLARKWIKFCQQNIPLTMEKRLGHDEYMHYYFAEAIYILGDKGYEKLFPESKPEERLTWSKYRAAMFDYLLSRQNADGSWNIGPLGAVYSTACCLTILQLDNAAVPAYQR